MKCWICGNVDANSREHTTKASDLRLQCSPTQESPIYYQTKKYYQTKDGVISKIVRYKIGSLDNDKLKFKHYICHRCNTTTTQSHDRGWESLSAQLLDCLPQLRLNQKIRFNRIIAYDTKSVIKNAHLYFVKLFGCRIIEYNMAIDILSFSEAILGNKPHPNLYLSFGYFKNHSSNYLATSSAVSAELLHDKVAFASWFYTIGALAVNVMYAESGEDRNGLIDAWNPNQGYKRFTFKLFGSALEQKSF